MTPETVFAKSPKGIEEIETRAHKLGSRLRQVLIRVDGMKTLDELVGEAGEMGEALVGQIEELEREGFLTDTTVPDDRAPTEPAPPVPAAPTPHPRPRRRPRPRSRLPPPRRPPPHARAAARPSRRPSARRIQLAGEVPAPGPAGRRDGHRDRQGRRGAQAAAATARTSPAGWTAPCAPIEQAAGKAKAKAFYKNAKKLVGG